MTSNITKNFKAKSQLRAMADGGGVRVEPKIGTFAPLPSGGGGGLSRDAVRNAAVPPAPAPAPAPALPADYLRNPGSVLRDREKAAGLADGGSYLDAGYAANKYQQAQLADGGKVKGKGGRTADKVGPVMLSDEEYVLPGDTADAIGRDNLDAIRAETHDFVDEKKGSALRTKHMANGGGVDWPQGFDVQERPMSSADAKAFGRTPNDPAFHGSGRYGAPPNPTAVPGVAPQPVSPLPPTAPASKLRALGATAGRVAGPLAALGAGSEVFGQQGAYSPVDGAVRNSATSIPAGGTFDRLRQGDFAGAAKNEFNLMKSDTADFGRGLASFGDSTAGALGLKTGLVPAFDDMMRRSAGGAGGVRLNPTAADGTPTGSVTPGASTDQAAVRRVDNAIAARAPAITTQPTQPADAPDATETTVPTEDRVSSMLRSAEHSKQMGLRGLQQEALTGAAPGMAVIDNGGPNRNAQFNDEAALRTAAARGTWSPRGGYKGDETAVAAASLPIQNRAKQALADTQNAGETLRSTNRDSILRRGQDIGADTARATALGADRRAQLASDTELAIAGQTAKNSALRTQYEIAKDARDSAKSTAETGGKRLNDTIGGMFVTPDNKPDLAGATAFRSFVQKNAPNLEGELTSAGPEKQAAVLQQWKQRFDMAQAVNKSQAAGFGGQQSSTIPRFVGERSASMGDVVNRGLSPLSYAAGKLPFIDGRVLETSDNRVVPKRDILRPNGTTDLDIVGLVNKDLKR